MSSPIGPPDTTYSEATFSPAKVMERNQKEYGSYRCRNIHKVSIVLVQFCGFERNPYLEVIIIIHWLCTYHNSELLYFDVILQAQYNHAQHFLTKGV